MTNPRIRVLLNIAWLVTERLARIAAGLAVGIVVARHLGPTDFGKISYVQAFVAVVGAVAGMGLEPILMKELITDPHERHLTYSTAIGIAGISSVAASVIGLCYSFAFINDPILLTLYIIGFTSLPITTAAIIAVPLQAQEKFALLVRYQLVQICISVTLRFLLVWLNASLAWFMFAFTADAAVWILLLWKLKSGHETKFSRKNIRRDIAAKLTAAAAPLLATNLVVLLQIRVDQMLLGLLASTTAVGNFSVASKIAEGLMTGPAIVIRALNPQLLQAKAKSGEEFRAVLRRQFDLSVMIAVIIAAIFSASSGFLVRLLFGAQYHDAAVPLAILSWIIVPMTIGSVNANAIIAEAQTRQTLVKATIGLGMNALLNYLFIPLWGGTGSAIATLTSHVCSAYFGMLIFQRQRFQFLYATKALAFPVTLYRYRHDMLSIVRRLK
jgi:O-antigen/teichoic acid export membrane protein